MPLTKEQLRAFGSMGGKATANSKNKRYGFAVNKELARRAGRKGGRISKPNTRNEKKDEQNTVE